MPILYEPETIKTQLTYILKAKLSRPLSHDEIQKLHNVKQLMEQKANITIHKISVTPNSILIYYSPTKTQKFIAIITAIALIAAAIGLPIAAYFLTVKPPVGPLGLPYWTWIGIGLSLPILALIGLVIAIKRK